mmetsp:Transcript_15153/g.39132  ORF Transcript_15153/g.39132 Transcript_15153/m.39132 type:complete len:81 (-) Transcript_15153:312-554(-)
MVYKDLFSVLRTEDHIPELDDVDMIRQISEERYFSHCDSWYALFLVQAYLLDATLLTSPLMRADVAPPKCTFTQFRASVP